MRPAGTTGKAPSLSAAASSSAAASAGGAAAPGPVAAAVPPVLPRPPAPIMPSDGPAAHQAALAAHAAGARALNLPPAAPAGTQPRGTHGVGLRRIRLLSTINSREGRAMAWDRGAGPVDNWIPTDLLSGQAPRWQFANCRGDSGAVMWGVVHHSSCSLVIRAFAREAAAQLAQRADGSLPALPDGCDCVVAFHDTPGAHLSPAIAGALGPLLELRGFRCQVEHLCVAFTTNPCECSRYPPGTQRWCTQVSRQCGRNPDSVWEPRETAQWLHNEQWSLRAAALEHLTSVAGPILDAAGL